MTKPNAATESKPSRSRSVISCLPFVAAIVYFFSNPHPQNYYDYTFRVARDLLHGTVGFYDKPPSWLNEFIPFESLYFSAFPLGSVLTMIPFAALQTVGMIKDMPGMFIAALLAGLCCWYLFKIADRYDISNGKKALLTFGVLFGTWTWTNLTFAGAWQLALGFAMLGELGGIYFTVFDRRPILAGAFFALAYGNRTEILLTAPIFLFLWSRDAERASPNKELKKDSKNSQLQDKEWRWLGLSSASLRYLAVFCTIPFILGVATLAYNYVRFHSLTDFGYARIPGVLGEPWYDHGIFSVQYIPRQAWEMLWKMWNFKSSFPYLIPDGFSSSILFSSPFILFVFRFGGRDKALKYASWAAIVILTFLLWIHGNSGGWQFGYRYASILLPWIFVILLESSPKEITRLEWAAYGLSFAMNLYATWLFNWTDYVRP
ncbi:MAG: hypothetical protein ABI878_12685 [Acidobacteriota bacterium]